MHIRHTNILMDVRIKISIQQSVLSVLLHKKLFNAEEPVLTVQLKLYE